MITYTQYGRFILKSALESLVILATKCGIDLSYVVSYFPGHFYSPLLSQAEVASVADRVFAEHDGNFPDIDLRYDFQLEFYKELSRYYVFWPYQDEKRENLRYFSLNKCFQHADGYWLYAIMRHFKPKRIVEVGSGLTSCLMLDVNEHHFKNSIKLTFVEPYPDRLLTHVKPEERNNIQLVQNFVQDIDISHFTQLEAGDILFIDNSHVAKLGSDVLYMFHTIFPLLKPGVIIHLHDIFFPFEYPREWIEEKRWAWNECYFLRSFLQYNTHFEVLLFGNWLGQKHPDLLAKHTPMCLKDIGGSFWMRKK